MELKITIFRSARRRRTIQWRIEGDEVIIYMPDGLTRSEEDKLIERIKRRAERHKRRHALQRNSHKSLMERAQSLSVKYFADRVKINSIRYVTNQNHCFGSCSPDSGDIRISERLKDMPNWVRDYVIIHELAHLIEPNHKKRFWELVNNYKYTERARGFLIAKEMED